MSSPSYTRLQGVANVSDTLLSKTLENSIVAFFNWGMLCIGGFFNVTIPSPGVFGGSQHRLRPVTEDPYYTAGQVWEGFRSDWVWETGVDYDYQPIHVSGVNVNSQFYPTASTTGAYSHHVDYPLGRVVFNAAIPASSLVTCEYSYRYTHFTHGSVPWWRQVQTNSMRVDSSHFLQQGSGEWAVLGQNRVQLPAVVVEATSRTRRVPFEIGNLSAIVYQDVLFHVLAETPDEAKFLHDAITYQWQKRFFALDHDLMYAKHAFPLDANGSPASGARTYPVLVSATGDGGFRGKLITITGMSSAEVPGQQVSVWRSSVRATFEVDMP